LNDKVAIITGAGSGVGRAAALLFAREGARVVAADIREDRGEETLELMGEASARAISRRCDVARESEVAALIETAVATFGRLDILYNNAGVSSSGTKPFEDYED